MAAGERLEMEVQVATKASVAKLGPEAIMLELVALYQGQVAI
jgi:hypothetical protein